jgi:predicted DNA-binding WGR domain protein
MEMKSIVANWVRDTMNNSYLGKGWNILVNTEGHFKFWAFLVEQNGSVRVRWGKIGTYGQEQQVANGLNYIQSKVSEKLNKGYRWATSPQDAKLIPDEIKVLWEM